MHLPREDEVEMQLATLECVGPAHRADEVDELVLRTLTTSSDGKHPEAYIRTQSDELFKIGWCEREQLYVLVPAGEGYSQRLDCQTEVLTVGQSFWSDSPSGESPIKTIVIVYLDQPLASCEAGQYPPCNIRNEFLTRCFEAQDGSN
jgi:hypothetical protein